MNLHAPSQAVTDSNVALTYLKEGNKRFVDGNLMPRDTYKADMAVVKTGQKPFAAVLSCADSRTPPELFFDQKLGDIFVVRNAGNHPGEETIGSFEFAVEHLKVPLVVVVGHDECGAVINAFNGASGLSNKLQGLLDTIGKDIKASGSVEKATLDNVKVSMEKFKNNPIISKATIVGAIYSIGTGEVKFIS